MTGKQAGSRVVPAARAIADNEIHLSAAVEFLDGVLRNGRRREQERGEEEHNRLAKSLGRHPARKRRMQQPLQDGSRRTSARSQHRRLPAIIRFADDDKHQP